ncbi:MAG: hypothetical protein HY928_12195 [Elusimicrobia bacterium]|nr:hypothetical protein [Elusimicrobiota bacterium]
MSSSLERAVGRLALWAALLAAAVPAAAKVSFTGYGSFNFTADANLRVFAPPAVLGGLPDGTHRARGFSTEAVGLFAATPVGEDADFLMDVAYRGIGGTVRELRIQYAYLDAALPGGLRLQAGKVTLPLGYYNTRRFYPFRRVELSAPLFHSALLGLPIADTGGVLSWRTGLGDLDFDARLFGVNGYGSVPSSTASFRSAALPGGLAMSNNLGSSNSNRDVAVGGQAALSRNTVWEYGVSFYRGAWDRSGERLFQILGSHLHWAPGRFDVLAEFLRLDVRGDQGMLSAFGRGDWRTHGGFLSVSGPAGSVTGRPLSAYARGELYDSGAADGSGGHELVRSAAAGLSLRVNDWITWKGEYLWVDYRVPAVSAKTLQLMGYTLTTGLVVTF